MGVATLPTRPAHPSPAFGPASALDRNARGSSDPGHDQLDGHRRDQRLVQPGQLEPGPRALAGDDLVFGNLAAAANRTAVDNLSGLPVFNSITISASGYIINGSLNTPKMALSGSINVGSNLGNESITIDMQMVPPLASPQQSITVNTGSNLVIAGHLSGDSNAAQAALQTIIKVGPGILELSNDNSAYTGAFTIASGGGILLASNPNALGLGAIIAVLRPPERPRSTPTPSCSSRISGIQSTNG